MRAAAVASVLLLACGSNPPPPPAAPANTQPTSATGARTLTEDECQSLAQWIVEQCHERGNDRSSQTEGWCSDVESRALPSNPSWVKDCAVHVTPIDEACFRSAAAVRNMMNCDTSVSRP